MFNGHSFIHSLFPLISFWNRIKVLLNWGLSFITHDAALRLIIRPDEKKNGTPVAPPEEFRQAAMRLQNAILVESC
jgi:membrane protein insertase Oxa1/YidC/SpoIIIJ